MSELRSATLLHCLVIVAHRLGLNVTVPQLMQDNSLPNDSVTVFETVTCARRAGLKAKAIQLNWRELGQLKKALPVIATLKGGVHVVLTDVAVDGESPSVSIRDPNVSDDTPILVDRIRFEDAWTGEIILVRRDHDITDEDQPFSLGLISALVFRERRMIRDLTISAVILSFFALAPIIFWRLLSDRVVYYGAMNTFTLLCIGMALVTIFETIFAYLRQYIILVITARVDSRLSEYVFDKLLRLPIDFFERTQIGTIGHDLNEVWKIRNFMTGQLFGTVLDSFTLLLFFPVMFAFSPVLTLIVLLFCGLIVAWLVAMLPTSRRATAVVIRAESDRGAFLYQTLAGMRTVKSLSLETRQRAGWDVLVAKLAKAKLHEGYVGSLIQAGVRPLERLAVSGSFALGVYFAITTNDPVFVSALFAFLMLSQRVAGPLMQMAQLVSQYDEVRGALVVVGNLVNQPKEEGAGDHGVRSPLSGHVEFSKLRFKYQGSQNYALNEVSFEVPIGTTLGIVGRSGSGKTTVTRLLQRLHSEYEGSIKVDGVDIREYDMTHLRRSLGVVLQENFLFSGTIRENITAAKPHATFDEVVRAARLAGAEEFIDRLPRGYETYIYEGSPNLSGGQRQRLAIARALILDPRILILDEATSALDPDSEAIVNENIRRIAQGRTVIVISHRLSSLVNSDAILVLEKGQVADMGTHDELLERCDIYSGLWQQQNRHITNSSRPTVVTRSPSRVS